MPEIDEATGLVALPEGYYWHVRKSGMGSAYAYISIRKDRIAWRFFRVPYEYINMICTQAEIETAQGLRTQVNMAWFLYSDEFTRAITPGQTINPYGSYPPKRLED